MRPGRCLVAVAAVAALAGCGSTKESTAVSPSTSQSAGYDPVAGCKSPSSWDGQQAANYQSDCFLCKDFGVAKIASEYAIAAQEAVAVARDYARASYRPGFQQAGFEGCLRGFSLR